MIFKGKCILQHKGFLCVWAYLMVLLVQIYLLNLAKNLVFNFGNILIFPLLRCKCVNVSDFLFPLRYDHLDGDVKTQVINVTASFIPQTLCPFPLGTNH